MNFSKGLPNGHIRKALAKIRTIKLIILSGTPFQNKFGELHTIMRLLLPANDEAMVFLNPLTLDNVTYRRVDEIRKNRDHFLHIQNGAILLYPLSLRTSDIHERGGPAQTLEKKRCRSPTPSRPYPTNSLEIYKRFIKNAPIMDVHN